MGSDWGIGRQVVQAAGAPEDWLLERVPGVEYGAHGLHQDLTHCMGSKPRS